MAIASSFSRQSLIISASSASSSSFSRYSVSSSLPSASSSSSSNSRSRISPSCSNCGLSPLVLQGKKRFTSSHGHLGSRAAFFRSFSLSKPSKSLSVKRSPCVSLCSSRFVEDYFAENSVNGFEAREAPCLHGSSKQEQQLGDSVSRASKLEINLIVREEVEARSWWEEVKAILPREVEKRAAAAGTKDWGWLSGKEAFLAAIPGMAGASWNLEGPQSVLQALGVLAAIITVHEAGHFLAARLQGIIVTKFAVGFGPTLAKFDRDGVEYSLRTFPFGGFVAFPDDDPNSEFDPEDPNLLKNRPIKDRALVISAGVIANLIFAYSILFSQTLSVGLLQQEMFPGVMVPEVLGKSAAARAGMRSGDVVLGVDGYRFSAQEASVFELVDTIKKSGGKTLSFSVQRGPELVNVDVTPDRNIDGSGRIGVQLSPNARPHRVKAKGLPEAVMMSTKEFLRLTETVVDGLKQILFNFEKTVDSVSGPVAIVAVGAEVARNDISGLFQFAAIVNINLAIVNLLPLPALDGGYLAFVALEAIRGGKKLPDGVEQGIMSSGVLLLLMLGVVLMVRDTLNLGFVQQML
ncbi:hypothetical protein R1flu_027242 [Riccia fluitans]|uniref:PDZ domain-containing protein n=1 Tax=Riccia fluitans TaxID=41844 RepID=A0ABD1XIT0_9MARC